MRVLLALRQRDSQAISLRLVYFARTDSLGVKAMIGAVVVVGEWCCGAGVRSVRAHVARVRAPRRLKKMKGWHSEAGLIHYNMH